MSHAPLTEASGTPVAGATALPLPDGNPDQVRQAARGLRRTAARARATGTVRGSLAPGLAAVWTGDTAAAACAEATELARRARGVVEGLPLVAGALDAYASDLADARLRVRRLQREWDDLDAEHAIAVRHAAVTPDVHAAPALTRLLREQADARRHAGRVRLSRAHRVLVEALDASADRARARVERVTDVTLPRRLPAAASTVRDALTGGLWFADGAAAAATSRTAALGDAASLRRLLDGTEGASAAGSSADRFSTVVARLRAHVDDPAYAQALLEALGTQPLGRLLLHAGTRADVATAELRSLLGTLGSIVVTATGHTPPPGSDPATRSRLASGAALLSDELVAAATVTVTDPRGRHRASGSWLLGQLLAGARLAGDARPLPARLVRRLAAATAAAELAETRDDDVELRHGATLSPAGGHAFASWFGSAEFSGDALHLLLTEVGGDPEQRAALLAEPLPPSAVVGGTPANARGERLTLGEHLVRRWVTYEATGTETHEGLHLETDDDLTSLLTSTASDLTARGAETRARLMLELRRTSAYAMGESSTTNLYTRASTVLEHQVAAWCAAMRGAVDRSLAETSPGTGGTYVTDTAEGPQPHLSAAELAGVVAALAVQSGTGLRARATGAAYDALVRAELEQLRRDVDAGRQTVADVTRLGFYDRAASAGLVHVARRQDEQVRDALQAGAEVVEIGVALRGNPKEGLRTIAETYAQGGTMRTAWDDLVISLVRSDVELDQTLLDDERRAELVTRIRSIVGDGSGSLDGALARGAGRGPVVPTATALRAARQDEILQAGKAALLEKLQSVVEEKRHDRNRSRDVGVSRSSATDGHIDISAALERLPHGKQRHVRVLSSRAQIEEFHRLVTQGAQATTSPAGYDGDVSLRPDGVRVGVRESRKHGITVDLWFPDDVYRKVHLP